MLRKGFKNGCRVKSKGIDLKKFLLAILSFFIFASLVSAEGILSDELLEKIKPNGAMRHVVQGKSEFKFELVPATELAIATTKSWESDAAPVFHEECLFYITKADLAKASGNSDADTSIAKVSQIIRSVSKMKGMEYYSNGDKRWETLYHEAYLIDSPNSRNRIDDKIDEVYDRQTLYCILDDNSFGSCVYRLDYRQQDDEVSILFTNAEKCKFGPMTAVKENELKISLDIISQGDSYLIYMTLRARYPQIPLFKERLSKSFNARIDAIFKWFTMQF